MPLPGICTKLTLRIHSILDDEEGVLVPFESIEEALSFSSDLSKRRIGSGIAELIIAILILIPRTAWIGGIGAVGMMSGAILFHLTSLGTEVNNDGGLLFRLALIVFVGGIYIVLRHREDIPLFKKN